MKRASYVKTPPLTMICIFQLSELQSDFLATVGKETKPVIKCSWMGHY